jgi:hypothetical protein
MLRTMTFQTLRLTLDGMTAGDYLAHFRDPEPPALGRDLRAVEVRADPLGDTVEALLAWEGPPAPAWQASALAGFPQVSEVVHCELRALHSLDGCAEAA